MGIKSDFESQVEQYGPMALLAYRTARIEHDIGMLETVTEAGHKQSLILDVRLHLEHLKLIAEHTGWAPLQPTGKELSPNGDQGPQ